MSVLGHQIFTHSHFPLVFTAPPQYHESVPGDFLGQGLYPDTRDDSSLPSDDDDERSMAAMTTELMKYLSDE